MIFLFFQSSLPSPANFDNFIYCRKNHGVRQTIRFRDETNSEGNENVCWRRYIIIAEKNLSPSPTYQLIFLFITLSIELYIYICSGSNQGVSRSTEDHSSQRRHSSSSTMSCSELDEPLGLSYGDLKIIGSDYEVSISLYSN